MTLYGPDGNTRVDPGPTMECDKHGVLPLSGAPMMHDGRQVIVPYCMYCEVEWKQEQFPVEYGGKDE